MSAAAPLKPGPALRWPGSKWSLAGWIVSHLPAHHTYLEPYFGSGAVFFTKGPSPSEYLNDLDGEVVNLFHLIREQPEAVAALVEMTPWSQAEFGIALDPHPDPLERARRLIVRHWQSIGANAGGRSTTGWRHNGPVTPNAFVTRQWRRVPSRILATADRLKDAQISCLPALEVIRRLRGPEVCIYADPPYPRSVRTGRMYVTEMLDDADHAEMLDALDDHSGPVVLSGYACPLYDDRLAHWGRTTHTAEAEKGATREEVLWLNPETVERLDEATRQHRLF